MTDQRKTALDAATQAVMDFYPAEWGGRRGITRIEAEALARRVLDAAAQQEPERNEGYVNPGQDVTRRP